MAAIGQQSMTTYGYVTSIDDARGRTYATSPVAGRKRSSDEAESLRQDPVAPTTLSYPRPTFADHHQAHTLHPPPPRLQPSRITSTGSPPQDARKVFEPPVIVTNGTPGPTQNPLLTLRHPRYDLPSRLVDNFESMGVRSIYPWQSACLLGKGLLSGEQNLVYTAPTGGGKSLVADVLLLKRIIENPEKKAILVLPYVALVQEKLRWLRSLVDGVDKNLDASAGGLPYPTWRRPTNAIRVSGFLGGGKAQANWAECDVAVCTIEKANALLNTAIEDGRQGEVGILVLDELHMLNDEHRGFLMELLAAKALSLGSDGVQIVGMSATLSNPQLIAGWLKAKFYIAKYRPVPVKEHLVFENAIYPTGTASEFFRTASQLTTNEVVPTQRPQPVRTIATSKHHEMKNPLVNAVIALAVDTATAGHGALVFCSSRLGAERTALLISQAMPTPLAGQALHSQRQDLLASFRALPGGFESSFLRTVPSGVGFHHAGLTVEERDLVAEAYDSGVLKVMVATCSLGAGINLPARRVILHGARMGKDLIGPAMLRQMRGRAGRKGKDEIGETYMCCQKGDLEAVAELLEADIPPVESCLTPEKRGIKRALLEIIAIGLATSKDGIHEYVRSSLLWHTMDHDKLWAMVESSMADLLRNGLVCKTEHQNCFAATKLGSAVVASSLSPEDGVFVHGELRRALESFVMDGDMHIFYLFTPVQAAGLVDISWLTFRSQLESLDESGLRAVLLIGIRPAFVNGLVNSGAQLKETTPEEKRTAQIYRRAYSAFQLRDLCNEMPVHEISVKYDVSRGQVQTLAQTCHGFAAGMVQFCERMEWGMLAAVLEHMRDRLRAGAKADLLEMAQVAFVKSRMARIFWESGYKSVRALAEAQAPALVPVMMQAQGRKARLQGEAGEKLAAKLLAKAEIIVSSASRLWEKQQMLQWEEE